MKPCPLVFNPIFKPKIWGGRRLEALVGKALPGDERIGESWEVADLEDNQSVVARGPAAGRTLGELVKKWGTALVGDAALFDGRFPLLIKYLDASENLSVQVHPDRAMAARLGGRVRVKNEAWYILDAEPGACIYRGLVDGVDRESFARAIADGVCDSLLNRIEVRRGQCYYLPSGTVHAVGGGVTLAEVQTPSDVTYRVFDWNRIDPASGVGRELHVTAGLDCINFGDQRIDGETRSHVASVWTTVTRLTACESFIIERVKMVEGLDQDIPYAQLVIWMVLAGRGTVTFDGGSDRFEFGGGDTVVLPAGLEGAKLAVHEDCTWLEVTAPGVHSG
jgi:mannose-6-phosphate isomerase